MDLVAEQLLAYRLLDELTNRASRTTSRRDQ
jgi:hypothetical protein